MRYNILLYSPAGTLRLTVAIHQTHGFVWIRFFFFFSRNNGFFSWKTNQFFKIILLIDLRSAETYENDYVKKDVTVEKNNHKSFIPDRPSPSHYDRSIHQRGMFVRSTTGETNGKLIAKRPLPRVKAECRAVRALAKGVRRAIVRFIW